MAANEVVVRIARSLGEIADGPINDLKTDDQKLQRSEPFEKYGLHWLVSIEKEPPSDGGDGFNLVGFLYCLSVKMGTKSKKIFPLKGWIEIPESSDNQPRKFHGRMGKTCNVIGKQAPADAVKIGTFELSLVSGETKSGDVKVDMDYDGATLYYDEDWCGAGEVLLENHVVDQGAGGDEIEVTVRFLKMPRPLFEDDAHVKRRRDTVNRPFRMVFLLSVYLNIYFLYCLWSVAAKIGLKS